jgi:hypothetical protein
MKNENPIKILKNLDVYPILKKPEIEYIPVELSEESKKKRIINLK